MEGFHPFPELDTNVRIFNTALTASQVNKNHFAEVNSFQNPTPSCPSPDEDNH